MAREPIGVRLVGFSGFAWFYGSLVIGGVTLLGATVSAFFLPPKELISSCLNCTGGPAPVLTWTGPEIRLLFAGLTLASIGSAGLALGAVTRRHEAWPGVGDRFPLSDFVAGAPGWILGMSFLELLLLDTIRSLLPNGASLFITVGSVCLLALSSGVWAWRLSRSPSKGHSRPLAGALQPP